MQRLQLCYQVDRSQCIEFPGCKVRGCGVLGFAGRTYRAHRLAYCKAHNLTPDAIRGLIVRHACDNRACINPDHLLLGTQLDNMRDAVSRHRQARGERNGRAKLTWDAVVAIRQLHVQKLGCSALAARFQVGRTSIRDVVLGRRWRHVPINPDMASLS